MVQPFFKFVIGISILISNMLIWAGQTYYVAPFGNDQNTGLTAETPFRTIQKAASVARAGDQVLIRGGIYRETVIPTHSGTQEQPILFAPYQNEKVIISGTEMITGWKPVQRSIYKAPLSKNFFVSSMNQSLQVFVDGKMMILAQWPNTTLNVSQPVKAQFSKFISKTKDSQTNLIIGEFEDQELSPQVDGFYEGAEIFVQPNFQGWSWAFTGKVIRHRANRITFQTICDQGKDGQQHLYDHRSRYYLYNKKELLDAPGEWFYDEQEEMLYLIPPNQDDPNLHQVEVKKRDYGFNLTNRSYITIRGLYFFACTITTDTDAGGNCKPVGYPWRGSGTMANSRGIVINSIEAQYLNHFTDRSGHFIFQWGTGTGIVLSGEGHVLKNSILQYSAGNGVQLIGKNHQVINNIFADMNYAGVDCAAINSATPAETVDYEIAYNTITRCGRSGITPRGLANSDPRKPKARIHHNHISWCMLQDWDGGGIYWAGTDSKWLRIDHNLIHDVHGFINAGIYPDYCKNIIIHHNIVYNCEWSIHIQGAFNPAASGVGTVNNTLVYNNTLGFRDYSQTGWGPFGIGGGNSENIGTVIANNILFLQDPHNTRRYTSPYTQHFQKAQFFTNLEWDGKIESPSNPRFMNLKQFDFRITKGSPAAYKGTKLPNFEYEGVTVICPDLPQDSPVSIGALMPGESMWRVGSSLPQVQKILSQPVTSPGDRR